MLTLLVDTNHLPSVTNTVQGIPRLEELITLRPIDESLSTGEADLLIDQRGIVTPLSWDNTRLPFLSTSPVPFSADTLLGLIFERLGNQEQAQEYFQDYPALAVESVCRHCLQYHLPVLATLMEQWETHRTSENAYQYEHNIALLQQYDLWPKYVPFVKIKQRYQKALSLAPDDEHRAFTVKQYATLLLDAQFAAEAETLLQEHIPRALSEEASYALKATLVGARMAQLVVPYDQARLEALKSLLWDTLSYYEQKQQSAEVGLLLIDASEVANISESYSESLGYINRALDIFHAEDMPELAASSLLRKGVLLYTWAQNDNPQFYQPAIDAYQQALKVFKRDEAPEVFAQIHMHLGVLYAEMSTFHQKKSIWAAISASSFQEALNYYTRQNFPYEYGLACSNYANALTKYPTALRSDNYEKALEYYQEALQVRTPQFPYERALTLLNYLEASWHTDNGEEDFNQARYRDMQQKAQEVKQLVDVPDLLEEADKHLAQLEQLKQTIQDEGYA